MPCKHFDCDCILHVCSFDSLLLQENPTLFDMTVDEELEAKLSRAALSLSLCVATCSRMAHIHLEFGQKLQEQKEEEDKRKSVCDLEVTQSGLVLKLFYHAAQSKNCKHLFEEHSVFAFQMKSILFGIASFGYHLVPPFASCRGVCSKT